MNDEQWQGAGQQLRRSGLRASAVQGNGPADSAGIKPGDVLRNGARRLVDLQLSEKPG